MKIIDPSFQILTPEDQILGAPAMIEAAGRTCYKSEDKITGDSARKFLQRLAANGHGSVLEHASLTVRFTCDRGVSHELVRHRIASFSQESTRYCNYSAEKFGGLTFIRPPWVGIGTGRYRIEWAGSSGSGWNDRGEEVSLIDGGWDESDGIWFWNCANAERSYDRLLEFGWKPEQARSVLPNSLKTEVVMTANLREWRYVVQLRSGPRAHPQMRQLMIPLSNALAFYFPDLFEVREDV
jgi:thymidylate synthase (FAD)